MGAQAVEYHVKVSGAERPQRARRTRFKLELDDVALLEAPGFEQIVIDTTRLSVAQVADTVVALVERRLGWQPLAADRAAQGRMLRPDGSMDVAGSQVAIAARL